MKWFFYNLDFSEVKNLTLRVYGFLEKRYYIGEDF